MILTSFSAPTEGIVHQQVNTHADVVGKNMGKGVLYVAESCVSWMSDGGEGFSLQYPSISLHAVSRDLTAYPHECLYLMVNGRLNDAEMDNGNSSEEEDEEDVVSDVRFIPEDKGTLDAIFQAMSSCQALHPDEEDTDSEDEVVGDDEYYTSEDALEQLTDQGRATLQRLEAMLESDVPAVGRTANGISAEVEMETEDASMETGQFEDAEH